MTTTQSPRVDPRIRDRRVAVTRAAGRKRLRLILIGASVIAGLGAVYLGLSSPLLDVDRITVVGVDPATATQVRASSGVHEHDALVFIDTGAIARRIEKLPWVAHASVSRELPGTVKVTVTRLRPSAYITVAGHGVLLVARNGRVFASAPHAPGNIVAIIGVRRAPALGSTLSPAAAARVVSQLPHALATRVRAVDVHGDGLALVLRNAGDIRLGSGNAIPAKAAAALAVLADVGNAPFVYLDVSTPQTPVLQR